MGDDSVRASQTPFFYVLMADQSSSTGPVFDRLIYSIIYHFAGLGFNLVLIHFVLLLQSKVYCHLRVSELWMLLLLL